MKTLLLIASIFSFTPTLFGQTPIDIYESTLKIKALDEEFYMCGLAEGDQLIFSFEELNGKELKEIEILEYPRTTKFMDYKSKKINNKTITISNTGIYKFRFSNGAITGRICKFKVQRIPASDKSKNFNTTVYYRTNRDTVIENLTDQVSKVHSSTNSNGNRTNVNFTLPKNTVAWSYYIGVDQAGQESFEKASSLLAKNAAPLVRAIPGYGPLAALALGSTSFLAQIQAGEDIDYVIVSDENKNLLLSGQPYRYYKRGKVLNDFSKMAAPLSGMYFICLSNDNAVTGVTVLVKVTAITVTSWVEPYLK
jgi:hypothetical protein